ncbi:MAG: hypothetical protein P8046_04935 [Anaerolineales bacterium]|jgi:uncharacterized protein HemX
MKPTNNKRSKSKHHIPALVTAFGITFLLGIVMLALGANAFFKTNLINAKAASVETIDLQTASPEEIQTLIETYQKREAQYQKELDQAAQQLSDANSQIAGYQSVLHQLQSLGVIQVSANGQISVLTNRPVNRFEHDD